LFPAFSFLFLFLGKIPHHQNPLHLFHGIERDVADFEPVTGNYCHFVESITLFTEIFFFKHTVQIVLAGHPRAAFKSAGPRMSRDTVK
jgi:hypothetical protein